MLSINLSSDAKFKLLALKFQFILFYVCKEHSIKEVLSVLRKSQIKYLYLSNLKFNGISSMYLQGTSLLLFTNDLSIIKKASIDELQLYLLSIKGYFVNLINLPLSTLYLYENFYMTNYYFIIQYLIYFYKM